tara:strand:- start:68 stop:379 length:312 start_codon:yes stop_codon:yes gene_type:complete
MIDIAKTILAINPNAEFKIIDENFNTIEWLNGTTSISKSDIEAKQAELQAAYDAKQYQRDRATAYAEIKEQLDLLYHDMVADKGDKTGEWFKAIKAVKDENPK